MKRKEQKRLMLNKETLKLLKSDALKYVYGAQDTAVTCDSCSCSLCGYCTRSPTYCGLDGCTVP